MSGYMYICIYVYIRVPHCEYMYICIYIIHTKITPPTHWLSACQYSWFIRFPERLTNQIIYSMGLKMNEQFGKLVGSVALKIYKACTT